MNDRYLFRGKKLESDKWVQGYYVHQIWNEEVAIVDEGAGELEEELIIVHEMDAIIEGCDEHFIKLTTLGQCTGLRDKNGKLIFEGDIVKFDKSQGAVIWGNENCFDKDIASHSDGWIIDWQGKDNHNRMDLGFWAYRGGMKIIGNVHDNLELLECVAA